MQPLHLAAVPSPLPVELGHRVLGHPHGAAQAAQRVLVVGYDVGAAQLRELDPVLQGAQEAVRLVERGAVVASDVPAPGELRQRAQRRRCAHRLVGAAVHHLQELHGELDVAQAPRAELELPLGLGDGDVLHDPAAHRLDLGDEPLALGRRPHRGRDALDVLPADLGVPRDRTSLEQRLELPGVGPAFVVALVAGQRADQRAGLALRAQRRVHRPDRALPRVVGADPDQVGGELGADPHCRLLIVAVGRLDDEDDVDVADVVELVTPALAHRDDREPRRLTGLADAGARDGQASLQRGRGQVGELGRDVVDPDTVRQVAGGEAEQQPAVLDAHRVDGLRVGQGRRRAVVRRVGADRLEHAGAEVVRRRPRGLEGGVGQVAPVLGVPEQVVAERRARAEHAEQPPRGALVVGHGAEQIRAVVDPVGEVGEVADRLVGVGRDRAESHHRVTGRGDPVEGGRAGLDVAEAQPGQPPGRRADAAVAHGAAGTAVRTPATKLSTSGRQVARSSGSASRTCWRYS